MEKLFQELIIVFALVFSLTVIIIMLPYAWRALIISVVIVALYRLVKFIVNKVSGQRKNSDL